MLRNRQQGWVAWAFSGVLFITSASVAWLYMELQSTHDEVNTDLRQAESALRTAERNLERASTANTEANAELSALRSRVAELTADKASLESDNQSLDRQLQRLSSTEDELATELEDLSQANEALTKQTSELTSANTALSLERDELALTVETLEASLAEQQQTLAARTSDLETRTAELSNSRNRIEILQGELNEAATTEELYLAAREQLALEQAENETYSETIERLKKEMAAEAKAMNELEGTLQSQLVKLNQEKEQLVTQLEDGTTAIKLPESILFASGSAELNDDGLKALEVLGDALRSFPNHLISVQGHTDSKKISSTTQLVYPTNWELSSARAASAVRALLKRDIPAEQMQAVGFADSHPLVVEVDDATRQQNRRIEVILFPNQFTTKILE